MNALRTQISTELKLNLRNGEQLLLTLGIPVLLLTFFSLVDVLPVPEQVDNSVDYLAPGILALAVLSSAFTGLAIATGFERQYGVLKRLGTTPLGRPRLLIAKTATVIAIELIQLLVLLPLALALGWSPSIHPLPLVGAVVLATIAFAGVALLLAGTLPGLVVLAAANAVYLVLLLFSDIIIPLDGIPGILATLSGLLPSTAFAQLVRASLAGGWGPTHAWVTLSIWALVSPALASKFFRWQ
ncbi:MAG: ABC transporter permease [Acidimicrobiia bacterium]